MNLEGNVVDNIVWNTRLGLVSTWMGDHHACVVLSLLTPIVDRFPVEGVRIDYSDLEIWMELLDQNTKYYSPALWYNIYKTN